MNHWKIEKYDQRKPKTIKYYNAKKQLKQKNGKILIITALVSFQSGFIGVQIQDASTLLRKHMKNLKIEMIMKTNAIGMRECKSQEKSTHMQNTR